MLDVSTPAKVLMTGLVVGPNIRSTVNRPGQAVNQGLNQSDSICGLLRGVSL